MNHRGDRYRETAASRVIVEDVPITGLELGQRGDEPVARAAPGGSQLGPGELRAQRPARADEPDAYGRGSGAEHVAERRCVELVPVVQLEQQLLLERELLERRAELLDLFCLAQPRARRRLQVGDRAHLEVEALVARPA